MSSRKFGILRSISSQSGWQTVLHIAGSNQPVQKKAWESRGAKRLPETHVWGADEVPNECVLSS